MTTTPEREALAAEARRLVDEFGKATVRASMSVTDENLEALIKAEGLVRAAIYALAASPAAGVPQPLPIPAKKAPIEWGSGKERDWNVINRDGMIAGWNQCVDHMLAVTPPAAPAQAMPQGALTTEISCLLRMWQSNLGSSRGSCSEYDREKWDRIERAIAALASQEGAAK